MPKETHNKEAEILERALEAFNKLTGLGFVVEGREVDIEGRQADVISLAVDGKVIRYVAEIEKFLTPVKIHLIFLAKFAQFHLKRIIVTDYINPNLAEQLRKLDIPFIDMAGNAYINEPPVFIFIKGNKQAIEVLTKKRKIRAFQPTGLKVVFAFLCQPELVNAPYREIAKKAKVALGTVGWAIRDLNAAGFLIGTKKRGRRLINKRKLLDRWTETYPENLRPKLMLGRFQANEDEWWKFTQIQDFDAYWGGEVAAAKTTQYLRPEIVTIYVKNDPTRLLLQKKLAKKPNGNVEILKAFWEIEYNWPYKDLVPPILIYADLIATGDARNTETAKIIYERELARLIGED
ncbi:MAG TPA: type IV toxin-antitoxin system AbiEi family antitoxin [Thermodesulfobacteriota bacterium]|nr:type IV toxin-antitoxin system AbiEi family antitoxin [Thermodesulfobacteriota bacterium]